MFDLFEKIPHRLIMRHLNDPSYLNLQFEEQILVQNRVTQITTIVGLKISMIEAVTKNCRMPGRALYGSFPSAG